MRFGITDRRSYLAGILLVVAMLFTSAAAAQANEFPYLWYGGEALNCWQTGQHGSESHACDSVGAGFLEVPGRMVNGGIGQNVDLTPSGDYCSSYVGDVLNKQDPNNEGPASGFQTPTPYGSYQEWDGNNVCQAKGTSFGEVIRKAACTLQTCGMHHYTSFKEQGYNDRPWEKSFGNPALVISAEADIALFSGKAEGWGYVCPILQDAQPPHNILEYCLEQWRGSGNPAGEPEKIGTCALGPDGNNLDTLGTYFWPGTVFATELPGSANTEVAKSGWRTYKASITASDLKAALELVVKPYKKKEGSREENPEYGYGCGGQGGFSQNPAEWALIGVEQGAEGWNYSELGASEANLKLWGEYTPVAPAVSTGGVTEVQPEQATLHGELNPEGTLTNSAGFYYGATYPEEKNVSVLPVGEGVNTISETQTVSELLPATTYKYHLMAANSVGRSSGEEKTFTTPSGSPLTTTEGYLEYEPAGVGLFGSVDPRGALTQYYFEYKLGSEPAKKTEILSSEAKVHEATDLAASSLTPGGTYTYRLVAENTHGTSYGTEKAFTVPALTIEAASSVTETESVLHGTVNPGGKLLLYRFEYGTSEAPYSKATTETNAGEGTTAVPVSASVTGLQPATTYYYRLSAKYGGITYYSLGGEFTSDEAKCSGANITVQGSTLQALAQKNVWGPDFNTSNNKDACNGTQSNKAKPTVTYSATGSGAGLESWGVNKATPNFSTANAFVATDEPPNQAEKEEIESHETTKTAETLQTIPVAQGAVAVIVHLPANCTATSTSASGRLVLNNVTLEGIYRGTIKTWSEIKEGGDELKGTGCSAATEITRVVPHDRSGTSHVFKKYLNLINTAALETEKGTSQSWNALAEGTENTTWPKAAHVVKPTTAGDAAVATKVAETASSIGFADLADARANGGFSKTGSGGPNTAKFWTELQDNGVETTGVKYADPSTNLDGEAVAEANCAKTNYTAGTEKFPPSSTAVPWSNGTTATKESKYTLCALTYVLALSKYSAYASTSYPEATTVREFLLFALETEAEGGQLKLVGHDYEGLPSNLMKVSLTGVKRVAF